VVEFLWCLIFEGLDYFSIGELVPPWFSASVKIVINSMELVRCVCNLLFCWICAKGRTIICTAGANHRPCVLHQEEV
jgi:hypothetical protein